MAQQPAVARPIARRARVAYAQVFTENLSSESAISYSHNDERHNSFSVSYSFNKLKGSSASGRPAGLQKFTNIYE